MSLYSLLKIFQTVLIHVHNTPGCFIAVDGYICNVFNIPRKGFTPGLHTITDRTG